MLRRLCLVGIFVLIKRGSLVQLIIGGASCAIFMLVQTQAAPYRDLGDEYLASCCSFTLLIFFLCCLIMKLGTLTEVSNVQEVLSREQARDFDVPSLSLSVTLFAGAVGALAASFCVLSVQLTLERARISRDARMSKARRLRGKESGAELEAPLIDDDAFHCFLSHVWETGQDQMRIVKQRLLEMIPDLDVFLDVDDLEEIGDLQGYIERTHTVLIFCSKGYFQSKNCMVELSATVMKAKPIVALVDPDASRGGLSKEQIREELLAAEGNFEKWGFADDCPRGVALYNALFAVEAIEWNRIGHFQDVTMRLIAERLLPEGHAPVYVQGELTSQPAVALPAPRDGRRFHVYRCPSNAGAETLLDELGTALQLTIETTQQASQLKECECMLVYLNAATWTSAEASAALAEAVGRAMDLEIRLLLAHEMIGVGGQETRGGCDFGSFFACPDGATPHDLITRGIYSKIAVALKGGAWREVSMALMAQALAEPPPGHPASLLSTVTKGGFASALTAMSMRLRDPPPAQVAGAAAGSGATAHSADAGATTVDVPTSRSLKAMARSTLGLLIPGWRGPRQLTELLPNDGVDVESVSAGGSRDGRERRGSVADAARSPRSGGMGRSRKGSVEMERL